MPRGVKLKWSIEVRRVAATWRGYQLAAYSTGEFFGYEVSPPKMISDYGAGFPTIEAAMTAAELAARMDFAERQAKKTTTKR